MTSRPVMRIMRAFAKIEVAVPVNPSYVEEARSLQAKKVSTVNYDQEKSGEYLSFLLLDPTKPELVSNKLNSIFANISSSDREKVLKQVGILFQFRIVYNSIAHTVWMENLESLEAKIDISQRKFMLNEFSSFVDSLLAASLQLNTKERLQLLLLITLSRLSSHRVLTSLIPPIIADIDSLSFTEANLLVSSLRVVFQRYQKVAGHQRGLAIHFISLEETLLADVVSRVSLKLLLGHFARLLPSQSLDALLESQLTVLRLMDKYVKLGGINSPMKKYYLDKLMVRLYEGLPNLDKFEADKLQKYYFMVGLIISHGRNTKLTLRMLKEAEVCLLKSNKFPSWKIINFGISTRNSFGDYDKHFYESVELPSIKAALNTDLELRVSQLISCLIIVYSNKTKDREIHELILRQVIEAEKAYRQHKFEVVSDLHIKGIHQWLSYGINCGIIPTDLLPMIADVANRLTAKCLCARHSRKFEPEKIGELPDSIKEVVVDGKEGKKVRLLDCINDPESSKFIKETFEIPYNQEEQFYGDNYNETLIKEVIKNYFPIYFEKKFELLTDIESIQACTYKWDAVLKFEDISKLIGFEISGQAYTSDYSGFQQKKKVKMEVLAKKGFIPVIIDVGSSKMKGYILENNFLMAAIYIIKEIRKQMKTEGGIELEINPSRLEEYERLCAEEDKNKSLTIMARTDNLGANNKIKPAARKSPAKASRTSNA